MSDGVLLFTFSPVQELIAEARRANDLYAGSQILVRLAKAAGSALQARGELIFPAHLSDDVPNRLVAKVPWSEAKPAAEAAAQALHATWASLAANAQEALQALDPAPDAEWQKIWERQTDKAYLWEIYWAAASLQSRTYAQAYTEADRVLAATKRQRQFQQFSEPGIKDTLSGKRQALRSARLDAGGYWAAVAARNRSVTQAKLRPGGREKLDAIGGIKRFGELASRQTGAYLGFPSASSAACEDYLARVLDSAELKAYNQALAKLGLFHVRKKEQTPWHYDGAFFYPETLRPKVLERDYGITVAPDASELIAATAALQALHQQYGTPSAYFAIIRLDGDNMGQRINDILNGTDPEGEHKAFSAAIGDFSRQVKPVVEGQNGFVVYNGGDDVLALAPLATSFTLAQNLADAFKQAVGQSASAGVAIVHHKYPLSAALKLAADAEHLAKYTEMDGKTKDAVAIVVLKRSGAPDKVVARWEDVQFEFAKIADHLTSKAVSSNFVYNLAQVTQTLYAADNLFELELLRLLRRSRGKQGLAREEVDSLAESLFALSQKLPVAGPGNGQARELSQWLLMASFIGGKTE